MNPCPNCGFGNAESVKFCAECGTKLLATSGGSQETRRTVTILFADVSGSTSLGEQLDPESMRALMGRYFAEMQTVIERHGGTVEKFIGDAVMAVFGIPQLHEDDALRAVRAAAEIGERLRTLNLALEVERGIAIRFRTGVNTGEVVAGDPSSGQTLITGDAVNTAARLEQAAAPGEIVLGPTTYSLVRDAVTVEALAPLELKGKAQPVKAYRLLSVVAGAAGHARRLDAPLVGRESELAHLQQAFDDVVIHRRCQVVTVLGQAGVGKSRLLAEFLASVADRATVLAGRCLPYGEGITYWPVAEVLKQVAAIDDADDRERAVAKLRRLAAGAADAELVAERIGQAVGLAGGSAPQEEIFWALRKLLETLARQRPLAIEFDDIQWADDTFLDLLEHIVTLAHDAPLLMVCLARPELLERRPGWGRGSTQAATLRLEPLAAEVADRLVDQLPGGTELPAPLRARILDAAEGNPLFVEEMMGMLVDEGRLTLTDGRWLATTELAETTVPPTISALLAARLDQLQPGERALAERASVVGQSFEQAALAELLPEGQRGATARDLLALVRKELIRPDRSVLSAGDAYRFRHLLIRNAAYDSLPKAERAELHARLGYWLERISGDRLHEYEEVIGYHLEQAHRYRTELGLLDAARASLAEGAAGRLTSAGRRALDTSGSAAAAKLLYRALALRGEPSPGRAETLIALGEALAAAGRLPETRAPIDEALSWARAAGETTIEAVVQVAATEVHRQSDPVGRPLDEDAAVGRAAAVLASAGLHREAAKAYRLIVYMHVDRGRNDDALRAVDQAIEEARLSQDRHIVAQLLATRAQLWTFWGSLPAAAVIAAIEPLLPEVEVSGLAGSLMFYNLAELYGLTGRFEEARAAAAQSRAVALDLGLFLEAASTSHASGPMERMAGNVELAEATLRADYETLKEAGEQRMRSTTAGFLAHVLCDRGALDEALTLAQEAERISAENDYISQALWRSARARALARRDPQRALASAAEAVSRVATAHDPVRHGDALVSMAEVYEAGARWDEALRAVQDAMTLFRAKGATAYVKRAEERRRRLVAQAVSAAAEPD